MRSRALTAIIAAVKNMFRMTLGKPKYEIPLSPFPKGELNIEWLA